MSLVAGQLEPVERKSLAGLVADRVRAGVTDGTFPPGEQVTEADLTRQLGVSRGAVREGLQRLMQEGLLEGQPGRGAVVPTLTQADVQEIYEARRAVERAAIERLIETSRHGELPELRLIVDEMAAASAAGEWQRTADLDLSFHENLVRAADNRRLERMYLTLLSETRLSLGHHYVGRSDNVESHRRLLNRIEEGDLSKIDESLREHLGSAIRDFRGERDLDE